MEEKSLGEQGHSSDHAGSCTELLNGIKRFGLNVIKIDHLQKHIYKDSSVAVMI